MRTFKLVMTGLSVLTVSWLGCAERPVEQRSSDTQTSSAEVRHETKEAVEAADDYAGQKTEEFKVELQKKVDDLEVSIDKLKARAGEIKEEARPEWDRQMAKLEEARQKAKQELAELKSASRAAWQDAKPDLEAAWNNLKQAFDDASKHFDE